MTYDFIDSQLASFDTLHSFLHRKRIYQNACLFYDRKKIVSAFLQIFQLMLDQKYRYLMNYLDVYDQIIISKYVSVTQNHLGGDIRGHLFFIAQIQARSIPAIAEKRTRKIAGTRSSKFVFYGFNHVVGLVTYYYVQKTVCCVDLGTWQSVHEHW